MVWTIWIIVLIFIFVSGLTQLFPYVSNCFLCLVLSSQDIECYVIDNNGFVLISKQRNDVSSHKHAHTRRHKEHVLSRLSSLWLDCLRALVPVNTHYIPRKETHRLKKVLCLFFRNTFINLTITYIFLVIQSHLSFCEPLLTSLSVAWTPCPTDKLGMTQNHMIFLHFPLPCISVLGG